MRGFQPPFSNTHSITHLHAKVKRVTRKAYEEESTMMHAVLWYWMEWVKGERELVK